MEWVTVWECPGKWKREWEWGCQKISQHFLSNNKWEWSKAQVQDGIGVNPNREEETHRVETVVPRANSRPV